MDAAVSGDPRLGGSPVIAGLLARARAEDGVVIVEYALLIGIMAVTMIPALTVLAVATNRYFQRQAANITQAEVETAQAQDEFIAFMDERIAYLRCLVSLVPPQPVTLCGDTPDPS
jgi:Flp pilus assembly pilin Flp